MRQWLIPLLALLLAGCNRDASNPAPPRVTTPHPIPVQSSAIAVPLAASLGDLERLLNAEVPRTVVTIDEKKRSCVKVPVVGHIGCRLEGAVTRGHISVAGAGDTLVLTIPMDAEVSAKDIAKVIKSETATATAEVQARVRLHSMANWQPNAKVDIDYRWIKRPGVDILGERITFAGRADPQLAKLIARLEATVPQHIAKLQPREKLEKLWAQGFTSIKVNDHNPPVWIRITPEQVRFRRYDISGGMITLHLGATAKTETFVGERPADPVVTPLPPPAPHQIAPEKGFSFHIPVIADYAQLEPVLERALHKLEGKPLVLRDIGEVKPKFGDVTIYPTSGGRLAIGVAMRVDAPGAFFNPRGTVWLTGQPFNEPGSQVVKVRDLKVSGHTKSRSFGVLLAVAESTAVSGALGEALTQNFAKDYNRILRKVGEALAEKRVGDFVISANIKQVVNGVIYPAGQGLYMPVDATGTAEIRFEPRKG